MSDTGNGTPYDSDKPMTEAEPVPALSVIDDCKFDPKDHLWERVELIE